MGRIENQFELVKKHAAKTQKLFEGDDMLPESMQNWFAVMELCAHLLKDIFNHIKLPSHKDAEKILTNMQIRGYLKKDYSQSYRRLSEYRVIGYFGEYVREPQTLPRKASLKRHMDDALQLFEEVKPIVESYIKDHKKLIEKKTGKK